MDFEIKKETVAIFAAGIIVGKFGKEIFFSDKARDYYVKGTVCGLKAKDAFDKGRDKFTAEVRDIYVDAKIIKENEEGCCGCCNKEYEDLSCNTGNNEDGGKE